MSYYIEDDDQGSLGKGPGEDVASADRPGDNAPAAGRTAQQETGRSGAADAGSDAADTSPGARTAAASEPTGTQDEPAMDLHDTDDQAKIDGIVAQTRADFAAEADPAHLEHALRQRFTDAGIDVDDERIRGLAQG